MIKPRKSKLFDWIFSIYCRNLLRRNFNSIRIEAGAKKLLESLEQPVLILANHSSWWDGLIAHFLSRQFNLNSYVLMEERQLSRYFLFKYLGAFSVVREDPRKAARSILFSINLLKNKKATLWMFPQGKIEPFHKRPIEIFGGAKKIDAKARNVETLLVGFRYEYLDESKADILIRCDKAENDDFQSSLTALLGNLEEDVANSTLEKYSDLLKTT